VYKGLYANHRSEGGTRLQRTVLRPESDVALENIARSFAQLRASALRHRLNCSTTDASTEPDLRVQPQRPSCHGWTVILGQSVIGTPLRKTWRSLSRSYALAPYATASITAQRTPPPSPICEFGRGRQKRHRSVAGLRASFLHRHGMPPLVTPAVPANAPPMAPRTPRIDTPSLLGSASRASRSLRYHPRTAPHRRSTPNSTKRERWALPVDRLLRHTLAYRLHACVAIGTEFMMASRKSGLLQSTSQQRLICCIKVTSG
jgi:hypothetical protein